MSSITKHKKSKYWSARFCLANGRRVTRSTKLVDRKKAQALSDKWEEAGKGLLSVTQIQRVTCEIYKEVTGTSVTSHTVRDFLKQWLERKVPEISPSSADKYGYTVGEFLRHLGERADASLRQLSEQDLISFRDDCLKKTRPKTINNKLVILGAAFREAWMDGYISDDISRRLKRIKCRCGKPLEKLPFTQQQVDKIIASAHGEWKGITLLGAYTGQRLGDIVSLKWGDMNKSGTSFVSRKTHRKMSVPVVHSVALDWLKANAEGQEKDVPLFPESYEMLKRNRHKVSALSKQFRALLVSIGYSKKRQRMGHGNGRGAVRECCPLSFHSFRHYLTTELYRQGVPAAVVQDIIGHDSEYVSRLYTHIGEDAKRVAMEQLAKAQDKARLENEKKQ
jgi:integrase